MISATVKPNGNWVKEMAERRLSFGGKQTAAATLTVPDNMRWWYWLEYGTASRADPGRGSGVNYDIMSQGKWPLKLYDPAGKYGKPDAQGFTYRWDVVSHPGIHPHHLVLKVMPSIQVEARAEVHKFMQAGQIRFPQLQEAVMRAVQDGAVFHIYTQMLIEYPGHGGQPGRGQRPDVQNAKLGGSQAADVFKNNATAVDTSK